MKRSQGLVEFQGVDNLLVKTCYTCNGKLQTETRLQTWAIEAGVQVKAYQQPVKFTASVEVSVFMP